MQATKEQNAGNKNLNRNIWILIKKRHQARCTMPSQLQYFDAIALGF
jgi:hypothetical protein